MVFFYEKLWEPVTMIRHSLFIQCLVLFSFIVLASPFAFPIDTNDSNNNACTVTSTVTGVCKMINQCEVARNMVRLNRYHTFPRCGFRGQVEIVCCPNDDLLNPLIKKTVTEKTSDDLPIWDEDDNKIPLSPTTTKAPPVTTSTPDAVTITDVSSETSVLTDDRSQKLNISKSQQACNEYNNEVNFKPTLHIIGGDDADNGEFPHMAALGYNIDGKVNYQCGGAIISNKFVITAGHCILRQDTIRPSVVRVGEVDLDKPGSEYEVEESIVHPEYLPPRFYNDIALLRLKTPITYTDNIQPACLYNRHNEPLGLIISGWGITDLLEQTRATILQKATIQGVELNKCNETYQASKIGTKLDQGILETQLCAYSSKSDACQGDSGGPLQVQPPESVNLWSIVGVTSFGRGCGGTTPGVYTRVSRYLEWIEGIVWP